MKRTILAATIATISAATPSLADTVDLSGVANADLNTYTNGSVYPMGGTTTINGIAFSLSSLPTGSTVGAAGDTGVLQLNANPAAGGIQSFTIPVALSDVGTVYTLANSSFGADGKYAGQITFNTTNGNTYTYTYTEGDNIRDHATTGFNVAANVYGTKDFGDGDRLDAQQIVLPTSFADETISSIVFSYDDTVGTTSPGDGEAFLAAITTVDAVAAVPEPTTWAMVIIGFFGIGAMSYRQRRSGLRAA
jgi:hypothetical protein